MWSAKHNLNALILDPNKSLKHSIGGCPWGGQHEIYHQLTTWMKLSKFTEMYVQHNVCHFGVV